MPGNDKEMTIEQFTLQVQGYASSATIHNDQVLKRIVGLS
jgi:hypothetical protein